MSVEFPVFANTVVGDPVLADLTDFNNLSKSALEECQAAILDAGVQTFGEDNYVLVGDGKPFFAGLLTLPGTNTAIGAVSLYNVEVTVDNGSSIEVEGDLLVASSPAVVAAIEAGVEGFVLTALDPLETIQTVTVHLV